MKDIFLTYVFVGSLVFAAFLLQLLFGNFFGREGFFLLFNLPVLISAWYGGFRPGLSATLLSAIVIFELYFFRVNQLFLIPASLVQLSIFVIEGIFVSYLFDRLKKTDVVAEFKQREAHQTKLYKQLLQQYGIAQNEIKARDEFLSVASHELKTPLTSMLLQIQTALHNIRNVSLAQFSVAHLLKMLESAQGQTNRLSRMINDLLNVSLITTKKMELELEEIDLSELTQGVIDNFSEKLHKEGYVLKQTIEPSIKGWFDKVRIEQAVTNLISNAIKYGSKKPIAIALKKSNSTATIQIVDQGIGIPHDQKNKIFDLFERAVPANKYKGLGVGLYITNQIVKAHRGKISVKSKENKGSVFTLELPIIKPK